MKAENSAPEAAQGQQSTTPEAGEVIVDDVLRRLANIDPQIAGALGRHPQKQLQAVLQASISKVTQHRSFLPPADEAEAWARIYPDAPKRIFDLAERRLLLSERQLEASIDASADTRAKNQTYRLWGLGAGLIVAGGFLVAGTFMAVAGGECGGRCDRRYLRRWRGYGHGVHSRPASARSEHALQAI